MTISLTKDEADLILEWVYMEQGLYKEQGLDIDLEDAKKNADSIEEKVKFAKMKENLKKVTRRLNKNN